MTVWRYFVFWGLHQPKIFSKQQAKFRINVNQHCLFWKSHLLILSWNVTLWLCILNTHMYLKVNNGGAFLQTLTVPPLHPFHNSNPRKSSVYWLIENYAWTANSLLFKLSVGPLAVNNCTTSIEFVQLLWQLRQKCVSHYIFIEERFAHTAEVINCAWNNLLTESPLVPDRSHSINI